MAEANDAYRAGDLDKLARIEAEAAADAPTGDSIGERIVAAIRRRAAATARLVTVRRHLRLRPPTDLDAEATGADTIGWRRGAPSRGVAARRGTRSDGGR